MKDRIKFNPYVLVFWMLLGTVGYLVGDARLAAGLVISGFIYSTLYPSLVN